MEEYQKKMMNKNLKKKWEVLDDSLWGRLPLDITFQVILPMIPGPMNQLNKSFHEDGYLRTVESYIRWTFEPKYARTSTQLVLDGKYSRWDSHLTTEYTPRLIKMTEDSYPVSYDGSIDRMLSVMSGERVSDHLRLSRLLSFIIYTVIDGNDKLFEYLVKNVYVSNFILNGRFHREDDPLLSTTVPTNAKPDESRTLSKHPFRRNMMMLMKTIVLFGTTKMISFVIDNAKSLDWNLFEACILYTLSNGFYLNTLKKLVYAHVLHYNEIQRKQVYELQNVLYYLKQLKSEKARPMLMKMLFAHFFATGTVYGIRENLVASSFEHKLLIDKWELLETGNFEDRLDTLKKNLVECEQYISNLSKTHRDFKHLININDIDNVDDKDLLVNTLNFLDTISSL